MKNRLRQLMLIVPLFWTGAAAAEEFDLNYYQNIFENGGRPEQIQAVASLKWAGLSDPALFDLVERQLKSVDVGRHRVRTAQEDVQFRADFGRKESLDYAAWMLKALGFSGNEKYAATLQALTKSGNVGKVRKYAKRAQGTLVDHAR